MTSINQLPAAGVEINVVEGDTFTLPLDFDINLTGYTIQAVNCQLLRARVSTAGVGVTAGYVLVRGF